MKWCVEWSIVLFEVNDAAGDSTHWASRWLPIGGMRECFTFDTILLSGEGEGDECGGQELCRRSKMDVEDMFVSNLAFNIFQAKWMLCVNIKITNKL